MDQAYRSRKLDLLLHLVANLTTPIVLKSANRPDTTDILRHLQGNALPNWNTCYVKATENLDFTGIVEELLKVLRRPVEGSLDTLTGELEEQLVILDRQHKCLVLLLDHAGVLMPGMLAAISQYARLHPQLKVVCALKPDEISAKTTTDALALVDAQIVPIGQESPAAETEKPAVSDFVMQPIVPPRRKPIAPPPQAPRPGKFNWRLALSLVAAGAIAGWAWKNINESPVPEAPTTRWDDVPEPTGQATDAQPSATPLPAATPGEPATATAIPETSATPEPTAAPTPAPTATPSPRPLATPTANPKVGLISPPVTPQPSPTAQPSASPSPAATPAPTPTPKPSTPSAAPAATPRGKPNVMADVHDADWLGQQNPKAYALQLVTVSQTGNIGSLIRRMPPSDQIAVYKINRGAGDLYFVLYGVYSTLAEANAAAGVLAPNNQGRPIPRQLRAIQDDIRRNQDRTP